MASLTFHGGVGEIGGNKILLEDSGKRIWFDFGMSFGQAGRYFSEFLQPKKFNGVLDFLAVGLLPEVEDMCGLYRRDYLTHCDLEAEDRPAYDALFISHAHADHSSYIHFLRHDIPIYASTVTRRILHAIEVTSTSGFTDFTDYTETFQIRPKRSGDGFTRLKGEEATAPRDFRVFDELKGPVRLGNNISVEAIPVNHSLPGACAYIIHTSEGAVVYTGDLRFHGYGGRLTQRFVEKASEVQPVALLCEGTRIDETQGITEQDVQDRVAELVKGKTLAIVDFPVRDTERMMSFLQVARASGRRLAISLKQAFLLKQLEGTAAIAPSLDDKSLAIYVRRKDWGLVTKPGYPLEIVKQDYDQWERGFLSHPNAVTCEDISSHQSDFIVRIDFFELPDLIALKPGKGSCYIRSLTEPLDEEDLIDLERVENWLSLFDLFPYHKVHASGHLNGAECQQLVRQISPKLLFPVHTEHPERFRDLAGPGTQVVLPERGKRYSIS